LYKNIVEVTTFKNSGREDVATLDVFEEKDFSEAAKVDFHSISITSIAPQVATEFIYDP